VGDFIYSRAFELLVRIGSMPIMDVMATTTNRISEGEVLQLIHKKNPDTTEAAYLQVIKNKTAILFAAACSTAAILAGASATVQQQLHSFGLEVGMAFQLIDDVLDYEGDATELGKNVGDDLAEGKPTMPLIYVMQNGSPGERQLVTNAILSGGLDKLDDIISIVRNSGGLAHTRQLAEHRITTALGNLAALADTPWRRGLELVADAAVNRKS
jgi:octaprenyl-diphosphate synthase